MARILGAKGLSGAVRIEVLTDWPERLATGATLWVEVEDEGDETILTLGVDQEDMGRVIGRDGRIANALRSLLRVMATRDGRHVELEIVSDAD